MQPIARYADLAGKTVFVSGGATGVGAAIVESFAEQGAKVTFADIDEAAGEALAATAPENIRFIHCDITDDDALRDAIAEAALDGALDVLVNNAANDLRHDLDDIDADRWRALVDVNLRHKYVAAQAAARLMKPRGSGAIINFGSVAPETMIEGLPVYAMCKSGARGLTRALAKELGRHGVRVNMITPGYVMTEKQRALWFTDQDAIDAVVSQQCLERELCGRDIAEMALFLASDASAACSAQDFIVDGGVI